ncbi:MAG: type II toxin-antitoxin system YafQ family toxin [Campylobacterales bacterium]|nr:type II toxin-antitoxin system YafQ family toxin [Campylobacterales bacterium]
MLKLFRSKSFIKDYKKIKFTDKLYEKYIHYISTLLKEEQLPTETKDHQLEGELKDFREFHISGDLLIMYTTDEEYLKLIRIGTHSELFE